MRTNRSQGAIKGWETRRRRQAERDNEWTDAAFQAGREELKPLLRRCLKELKYFKLRHGDFKQDLLADLQRAVEEK